MKSLKDVWIMIEDRLLEEAAEDNMSDEEAQAYVTTFIETEVAEYIADRGDYLMECERDRQMESG